MKTKITFLLASLIITMKLLAGAVTLPIASGASATTIQTAISGAVTDGNTEITLQFADGGIYGTSASSDIAIAVPAGVTKLTLFAPSTVTTKPILYLNTITFADALMTGGLTLDGLQVITSAANGRYLLQPSSTKVPSTFTLKNCYVEGYRAVFYANSVVTVSEVLFTNNIFKSITSSGIISTGGVASTISKITIRQNTIINSGGITTSDYLIDHRSTNYASTIFNFSQNTVYSPATVGRGFFRLPGNPTAGNYKLNNNLFAPSVSIELRMGYGDYTGISTDADSTNYYSSNYTSITRKSAMLFTVYTESSPSKLFLNPSAGDFTINDPDFVGKNSAGDPRWYPKVVSNPAVVTTAVSPANAGTVSPSTVTVDEGTSVSLTATKNFGYQFKEWQDMDGNVLSSNATTAFNIVKDTTIIAVFDVIPTYDYTVNVTGSNWGTVTLSPAPIGGKYETGTIVSMTAVNDSVSTFLNWEDNYTGKVRSITVDENKTFTATFSEKSFIVGWDLVTPEPKASRPGDYYSKASNKGIFSAYEPAGTAVNWLTYTAGGIPCGLLWTTNLSTRRYFQASFKTTGYKNIKVHSNMFAYNQAFYPGQKLLYSTDGTTFAELASCTLTASNWKYFPATLPTELEDQPMVYLRWIADETSTPVGSGNDGTGISNVYVFADEIATFDPVKPTLISTVPVEGSAGASANGSITLTFDKNVKAGTGNCTLESIVLTPVFGSKTATFNYNKLAYNTLYTFTVPAGALTNADGIAFEGITLTFTTMNRPAPTAKLFDAVVAKDGSGDYISVITAINAAPTGRTQPWLIFVKNGTYSGHVEIPANKPYINLIGQSRENVIISDARISGTSTVYPDSAVYGVDPGATVVVKSANCYFENICFENKFGYDNLSGPQALALYTQNDRTILNNCWLRSYQDTYLTTYGNVAYRHYVKNCRIEGAVDFIYGGGDVYFDKCTIYVNRPATGYIVAPSHQTGTQWGYVFSNCTIDGPSPSYTTYFGRPWANSPKASFFNTIAKINIYPQGWLDHMGAIPSIFADYNTMDAAGNLTDMSARIKDYWYTSGTETITGIAKNSFTDVEAAIYTMNNVLSGSDAWDPASVVETTDFPSNVKISSGLLTWNTTSYAICYIILRDNVVIGFTTDNTFTDNNYVGIRQQKVSGISKAPLESVYQIIAVSESGALSSPTIATVSGNSTGIENQKNNVFAYIKNADLVVGNLEIGSSISIYAFNGMLLNKQIAKSTTVSIPFKTACIVKVTTDKETVSIKVIE